MIIAEQSAIQLSSDLIARFAAIVGDRYAVTDAIEIAPYLTEERNLYQGRSRLVLRPGSTAEVAAICKLASETRTALVPQGGNTGLVGGQIPHHGEVVLSLRRLDKIREIDARSNTMTCEAGVVLAVAQRQAAEAGRLFPLSLGAEGSCTIGGNLSTNAGGTAALAYGVTRDLALGLEVVLADGRILSGLSKLTKDNTGYDLCSLFIGAEGTLGIITAAVMKLVPRPRAVETAFVGLASPDAALELLDLSQKEAAGTLTSFELIADICVEFCVRHAPNIRVPLSDQHAWYVLMEISSHRDDARDIIEAILSRAMEQGIVDDAVIAANLDQRASFWTLREVISPVQKSEGGSIKHDVSVPVAAVPALIAEANAAVVELIPGARPLSFGHLGDGNIHYNVSQPIGADKDTFLSHWHEVNEVVHGIVKRLGGSISAEHGIGVLKRKELPRYKDSVAMDLMHMLKVTLDPLNILNPGKVLGRVGADLGEEGTRMQTTHSARSTGKTAGYNWPLIALAIGAFGIGTTEFAPMGLLPIIAEGVDVSIPTAGMLVSAYAIGVMVGAPVMTLALSGFGKRTALMLLMTIFTIGNLLSAAAPGYATLLLARLVTSLNHGAFFGLGVIVAASVVPREKYASAVATMFMGLTIANIGGVPAATWAGQQIGWRMAFAGTSVLGLVAITALWLALPKGESGKVPDIRNELGVLMRPKVLFAMATTVMGAGAMFTLYTYVAPVLVDMTGASDTFITIALVLIGVGFTIGNGLGGRLADWSLDGATKLFLAILTLIMVALPLMLTSHIGAAIGLLAWGAAAFAIVPPVQMRVMQAAWEAPGLASSLNVGAFNLGNALGAAVGGGVISLGLGYAAIPVVGGFLAAAGLALVWLGGPNPRPNAMKRETRQVG